MVFSQSCQWRTAGNLMSFLRALAKSILPPKVTIRLRAAFKRHELERALLPALCDPAKTGIDIGAALGAYTWPLSRLCKSCIAFEPNILQAQYLYRAFGNAVRIEATALSDRSGEIDLIIPQDGGNDMPGLATIDGGVRLGYKSARRQKVAMRCLDSFDLEQAGFIKIDVEGHELAVLRGALGLLQRDRPALLIEIEERFATGSIVQVRNFLEPMGYRGLFLRGNGLFPISDFDAGKYQKMEEWGSITNYINNFIFITGADLAAARLRLARLGYSLDD